jgi:hypothetical protein
MCAPFCHRSPPASLFCGVSAELAVFRLVCELFSECVNAVNAAKLAMVTRFTPCAHPFATARRRPRCLVVSLPKWPSFDWHELFSECVNAVKVNPIVAGIASTDDHSVDSIYRRL